MQSIFIFVMILTAGLVKGQSKIEGLGKFKIGVTTIGVVKEVADELGVSLIIAQNYREQFGALRNNIVELATNVDNGKDRPEESSYCPDVRVFYISKYKIADIPVERLVLTFKKDKLIKLSADDKDVLMTAVRTKYGEGVPAKMEIETTTCKWDVDGSFLKLLTKSTVWQNGDIVARQYSIQGPKRNCKTGVVTGFSIELESERSSLKSCEQLSKVKAEAIGKKLDKDKLKDF